MLLKFETIHDEMNQKNTDPNSLVDSTAHSVFEAAQAPELAPLPPVSTMDRFRAAFDSPGQSTVTVLAPSIQPVLPSPLDIINDFNRIVSSTVGSSSLDLAKECENWIKTKCLVSFWSARERMDQDFNESGIDNLSSTMKDFMTNVPGDEKRDFSIQLFRVAVATQA